MDLTDFRARLVSWDGPLGPLREIEDIAADMERTAVELGAGAAGDLAESVCSMERERAPERGTLSDFLDVYAEHYPEALAQALLQRLTSEGPPLLVWTLGATGHRDAVARLVEAIDPDSAGEELLEALAGALGELGGDAAAGTLRQLQARQDLTPRVRREVEVALHNLSV